MIITSSEPARKLVKAHMSGFLSPEDVAQFSHEEQAAVIAMGCKSGDFYLLVDTSECVIQAQDIVNAFQNLIQHSPLKAKRIAVVNGGSLSKMQARRILIRDRAETFGTLEEAEQWLFAI